MNKIVEYIEKVGRPQGAKAIANALHQKRGTVQRSLDKLVREGVLVRTPGGAYRVQKSNPAEECAVHMSARGYCSVTMADGEIYPLHVSDELVFQGDLIKCSKRCMGGITRVECDEIITRATDMLCACVEEAYELKQGASEQYYKLVPTGALRNLFTINARSAIPLESGVMVQVQLTRWPTKERPAKGEVLQTLGDVEDVRAHMSALLMEYGLAREFPQPVLDYVSAWPDEVSTEELSRRRDNRAELCVTIDGETAQDFDDAIGLKRIPEGWLLSVHIADVSHYVMPDTPLGDEALARATSVYLPGTTLPMLPEKLSNGLCSLMPHVDRLAYTCDMKLSDRNGQPGTEVIGCDIYPSVINSNARLTYTAVNALFAEPTSDAASLVPDEVRPMLGLMLMLSRELRNARVESGALEFEFTESVIEMDESGLPTGVSARVSGDSEKLVEEFMLLANQTVARHARMSRLPIMYRVHEKPSPDKLEALKQFIRGLGYRCELDDDPAPKALQELLDQMADKPEAALIAQTVLRSMKKAKYMSAPLGHYGLAKADYCHFTSPIRRYPDLFTHRMLHYQYAHREDSDACRAQVAAVDAAAAQSSNREVLADTAERDADDLMKACYMRRYIGAEYDAVVSGVSSWAVYCELYNTVEGTIPLSSLNDYYELNEATHCLMGEHSRTRIQLGDKLRIRVESCDLFDKRVFFAALCDW